MLNRLYIQMHKDHPHYLTDSKFLSLQKKIKLSDEEEELLRIVRNLSDPTKLKIYLLLTKIKSMPVTDIAQILGLSQSAISHALTDLKNLGLVENYRCGQLICYCLNKTWKKKRLSSFLEKF
ncbi:winged helix-turn-helix transcriptional regulator [Candidatus Daviesbacteria bacterium]|nr:winged helix-turn-helix transcriptional regulator [Candidatus Daviesbacteria bacterium]MBI2596725.1 winged helix-turn-helix transcriptional regulator [Candidatus Daviesbacteria bacterium]